MPEPDGRGRLGTSTPGPAALTFAVLGGMTAWVLHIGVSYSLVPVVCETDHTWILHTLTAAGALVAGAATAVGAWAWRSARRREGAGSGVSIREFLGLAGLFLSGFFLVLIVVEGLPAFLQRPCDVLPTLDRPIIRSEHDPVPVLAGVAPLLLADDPPHGGWVAPSEVWSAWTWNPWVLGAIAGFSVLYLAGIRRVWNRAGRGGGIRTWQVGAYFAGMAALFVALVSPLHAVAESLFSVHMVQHMLLMVVAAPLLVLGQPAMGYLWGLPPGWRRAAGRVWSRSRWLRGGWSVLAHPVAIFVLHVGALWAWHLPGPYQAALEIPAVHHLEHASFFFTALLFWWALARAGGRGRWPGYGAAILYVFATTLQSGALGALLLFAREPWYPAHAEATAAWGLDLLVDQQVAGAVMWIPAGLVYAGAVVVLFVAWTREADRRTDRLEGYRAGRATTTGTHIPR